MLFKPVYGIFIIATWTKASTLSDISIAVPVFLLFVFT